MQPRNISFTILTTKNLPWWGSYNIRGHCFSVNAWLEGPVNRVFSCSLWTTQSVKMILYISNEYTHTQYKVINYNVDVFHMGIIVIKPIPISNFNMYRKWENKNDKNNNAKYVILLLLIIIKFRNTTRIKWRAIGETALSTAEEIKCRKSFQFPKWNARYVLLVICISM